MNQLPQPIVPLEFYEKFRSPLLNHPSQAVGNNSQDLTAPTEKFDLDKAIATYQELITQLPPLNRQLLLYILDLLSVFAFKSEVNLMTSANLAAIFQPGMLSHPAHDMAPNEYRLSQDVIIFLIDNQDSFLIGMSGTAADEQTVREVQAGPPTTPAKSPTSGLGRSHSNASGGADSARKLAGVRRNISVSSRTSKQSSTAHTPGTPQSGGFSSTIGVHRSNTMPTRRSPGLSSTRGGRGVESPTTPIALSPVIAPPQPGTPVAKSPAIQPSTPTVTAPSESTVLTDKKQSPGATDPNTVKAADSLPPSENNLSVGATPPKGRPSLTKQFTSGDGKDSRQPNKLRKKREPTRTANSSTNSLSNADYIDSLPVPENAAFGIAGPPPRIGDGLEESMGPSTLQTSQQPSESTLKGGKSPTRSTHSNPSVTDVSEQDNTEQVKPEKAEKRRWRFSSVPKKEKDRAKSPPPDMQGPYKAARKSTSSIGNVLKAQPTSSNDLTSSGAALETTALEQGNALSLIESSTGSKDRESDEPEQKRGLFGRLRARVEKSQDKGRSKDADKDRSKSKSPGRDDAGHSASKHSLSQIAHDIMPHRRRHSNAEDADEAVTDKPSTDGANETVEEPAKAAGLESPDRVPAGQTPAGPQTSQSPVEVPRVVEAVDDGTVKEHTVVAAGSTEADQHLLSTPPAATLTECPAGIDVPQQAPAQASTGPIIDAEEPATGEGARNDDNQ